jgi:beta-galactosidase beta subunit
MFDLQEAIKIALQKAMQADSAKLETGEYDLTGTRIIIDLKGKMSKGAAE